MKNFISIMLILVCMAAFTGCGNTKTIEGKTYDTYGLFNESEKMNPNISYQLITGNVVLGILLSETFIAPIYFFGFSLYEPVRKLEHIKGKGEI